MICLRQKYFFGLGDVHLVCSCDEHAFDGVVSQLEVACVFFGDEQVSDGFVVDLDVADLDLVAVFFELGALDFGEDVFEGEVAEAGLRAVPEHGEGFACAGGSVGEDAAVVAGEDGLN